MIFPIGKFKYLWGDVRDSYKFVGGMGLAQTAYTSFQKETTRLWEIAQGDKGNWYVIDQGRGEYIPKLSTNTTKKEMDIDRAIDIHFEDYPVVMPAHRLKVKSSSEWRPSRYPDIRDYIEVIISDFNMGNKMSKDEKKLINDVIEKGIDYMNYKDSDLSNAILSHNEIMLHCKNYYYFDATIYDRILSMGLYGKRL